MGKTLSKTEIEDLFNDIYETPDFILELSKREKTKIFNFAIKEQVEVIKVIESLLKDGFKSPDLEYENVFKDDPKYIKAQFVIDLLSVKPGNEKTAKPDKKNDTTIHKTFDSKLNTAKLEKLRLELINNNYIHQDTSLELFASVFTNIPIVLLNGKKIQWIDVPVKGKNPNLQTLFELLFLLKHYSLVEESNFDTGNKNTDNLYSKINNCFSNFENIGKKCPDPYTFKPQQNTDRKIKLLEIINSIQI